MDPTDAQLAGAAAGGDRGAFAAVYDRYADRLYDFCVGMLRNRDSAADCVQDTFCTAASRLPQLREPDKLRPWLYAIARNEALRRLREHRRETPSDELPDAVSDYPGPDTLAARTELADLIAEAAGGLSDRDRSVLELAYRHGLDGPELAGALGVSPTTANRMVSRLRGTIERSLGALLVSRRAQSTPDGCPDLAAILDGWDGRFSVLMRKRIARHIESCPTCDENRQQLVNPAALLAGVPVFIPAPPSLRERTLSDIRLHALATPIGADTVDNDAPQIPTDHRDADGHRRRVMLVVALFVATLIASLGLTLAWLHPQSSPITPTDMSGTAPETPGGPITAGVTPNNPRPAPPPVVDTTVPAVTGSPAQVTPPAQSPAPPHPIPVPGAEPTAVTTVPMVPPAPPPSSSPTRSLPPSVQTSQPPTRTTAARTPTRPTRPQPNTGDGQSDGRSGNGSGGR